MTTPLTCRFCGATGIPESSVEYDYVVGYRARPWCRDVVACWERVSQEHKGKAWDKLDVVKE